MARRVYAGRGQMREPTILHLTGMRCQKFGGLERYFLELAARCRARGHRSLFQYEAPPLSEAFVAALAREGAAVLPLELEAGAVETIRRLVDLVRRVRPAIVTTHFVGGMTHTLAPPIARAFGARKVVAMIHSTYPFPPLSARRYGLRGYDRVLGVSRAITEGLWEIGLDPARAHTHHLGLFDPPGPCVEARAAIRGELGIAPDEVVAATIAFDAPVKGLDLLLDAVGGMAQRPSLLVIGVDPERSDLPERAAAAGVRVHWAGIRERAASLLAAADLYVQPSRMEGLPLSVMEAMAAGLPVLASRVGGIPEAVVEGETGLLVPPTAEGLARGLGLLLAAPACWERFGSAGRARFLARFQGEDSIRRLVDEHYGLAEGEAASAEKWPTEALARAPAQPATRS